MQRRIIGEAQVLAEPDNYRGEGLSQVRSPADRLSLFDFLRTGRMNGSPGPAAYSFTSAICGLYAVKTGVDACHIPSWPERNAADGAGIPHRPHRSGRWPQDRLRWRRHAGPLRLWRGLTHLAGGAGADHAPHTRSLHAGRCRERRPQPRLPWPPHRPHRRCGRRCRRPRAGLAAWQAHECRS